ncbi:MAG: hypothetical protein E7365_05790 [Clostridiales bacterium]|nr:hypothetical protein [Clostridiales bacterium]
MKKKICSILMYLFCVTKIICTFIFFSKGGLDIASYFSIVSIPTLLAMAYYEKLFFLCFIMLFCVFNVWILIVVLSLVGIFIRKIKKITNILIIIAGVFDFFSIFITSTVWWYKLLCTIISICFISIALSALLVDDQSNTGDGSPVL